ncbi:conserved hypothetical protein [Luminiphilus syltensis NOR5-1B]|uniref:Dual-action ribosomal maturation protein DarP n=1 Tax=Luminiphilus syltensis NOR5-1B TaxID=565045 RepID=B8KR92_9GAMM|nr:ribosome biogenesis factor YjgA [Luminiphilus syltensis]EED35597.1 conserved hypothetical protein [Luminiphilus syltensis NOR5-1B]
MNTAPDSSAEHDPEDLTPSKSARKREMHALQAIGTRLVALSDNELATIPIEDETLREAIDLARRLNARGGLRRQMQFIGKLMRTIDPQPIEDALQALDGKHQATAAQFHRLEALRDGLIESGDGGINAVLAALPQAEPSQLRQLLRQHRKCLAAGKPSAVPRKLFRYLKSLDEISNDY